MHDRAGMHYICPTINNRMSDQTAATFYPENQAAWRQWLAENHLSKQSVWVIFHSKSSGRPTLSWSDAVDEALSFGWIDSKKVSIDKATTQQFFSKRKPSSTWSKINKDKVERLIAQGLMAPAGLLCIEIAKQNGSWTILDEVEQLIIPDDLESEFASKPIAKDFYMSLSKSMKKSILQWLVMAKTAETRQKRIAEILESAEQQLKPKHLR